jgi:hypothetical protein
MHVLLQSFGTASAALLFKTISKRKIKRVLPAQT